MIIGALRKISYRDGVESYMVAFIETRNVRLNEDHSLGKKNIEGGIWNNLPGNEATKIAQ